MLEADISVFWKFQNEKKLIFVPSFSKVVTLICPSPLLKIAPYWYARIILLAHLYGNYTIGTSVVSEQGSKWFCSLQCVVQFLSHQWEFFPLLQKHENIILSVLMEIYRESYKYEHIN